MATFDVEKPLHGIFARVIIDDFVVVPAKQKEIGETVALRIGLLRIIAWAALILRFDVTNFPDVLVLEREEGMDAVRKGALIHGQCV